MVRSRLDAPSVHTMATLQRPALRRTAATQPIRASFFDDSNDARNSPEAQQLREQITTVYTNTPFRGPAFQLPSGASVSTKASGQFAATIALRCEKKLTKKSSSESDFGMSS